MLVIIDGHNLVPQTPGINLSDLDDEIELVKLLQEYARLRRRQVEVFFDNAPAGQPRVRKIGTISVKFARPGTPADEEIRNRLSQLGNAARNCLVVSSDQRVQAYARGARAQVVSSEAFATELQSTLAASLAKARDRSDERLGEAEVNYWLSKFEENSDDKTADSG